MVKIAGEHTVGSGVDVKGERVVQNEHSAANGDHFTRTQRKA